MFRVLNCLTTQHDWRLVVVAGVVCFLSSLTAITLFNRARSTAGSPVRSGSRRPEPRPAAAYGRRTSWRCWPTSPGVPIAYNINLTTLSLLAAATITAAGLAAAVFIPVRWGAPIGGAIIGAGVACMHYLGMWAVELPGRVTWDLPLVAASIVLGMVLGMAALTIAVRWTGAARAVGGRHSFSRLPSSRIISRPWGRWKSFPIRRAPSPRFRCRQLRLPLPLPASRWRSWA